MGESSLLSWGVPLWIVGIVIFCCEKITFDPNKTRCLMAAGEPQEQFSSEENQSHRESNHFQGFVFMPIWPYAILYLGFSSGGD